MNCIHCERTAHASCRFCGRAVCKDHLKTSPFILSVYKGDEGVNKAIVVADAVFCGLCNPREQPVALKELK
jgi:hypothetical protein